MNHYRMMKVISIVFGMQYLLCLTQCFNIAFLNNRNVSYCILWNHYCIARVRLSIKTALFNILNLQFRAPTISNTNYGLKNDQKDMRDSGMKMVYCVVLLFHSFIVSYDKSINVCLYLVQYEIYFARHFIFVIICTRATHSCK